LEALWKIYGVSVFEQINSSPRNVWTRLLVAQTLAGEGRLRAADQVLDGAKYHSELPPSVLEAYRKFVAQARVKSGPQHPVVNKPADFLQADWPVLHPPFREIRPGSRFPSPFPYGLSLPAFPGKGNDHKFIIDAAVQVANQPARIRRIHVVWAPLGCTSAVPLLQALEQQEFAGQIALTVFTGGQQIDSLQSMRGREILTCAVTSEEARIRINGLADETDLILFLSGDVHLSATVLQQAAFVAEASDAVVQPIVVHDKSSAGNTPFGQARLKDQFKTRYPFRKANGMNFAISPALLRQVGGPDSRFASSFFAAREMLFRAFNAGCYMVPLGVPKMEGFKGKEEQAADKALYVQLCPEHWGRTEDGAFEIPKVSIYIPVYNASKYIERAVDSVLDQDVRDLEMCLHDDGSSDATLMMLQARYGNEPRVRWQTNPNGGIGFASNQAIRMSRGMYIGQLDSDDCLKPGAVRRLMEHMDENPDLACCYGSCERVDAMGHYLQDEYSWPVFSREKMLITSIAHHFRMFRRAAWERTTGFREDIVNAVDYDIFLKMSEVGEFHHIDEKLYQRRWHGENTSNVNEGFQTANTYHVQREALARQGLDHFWDVHLADPKQPRKVSYRRRQERPLVLFWPHYRSNPYQRLLYAKAGRAAEFCAGKIEAALRLIETGNQPGGIVFHLHWLNFLFVDVSDPIVARARVDDFVAKLTQFKAKGGRLIWTIHNTLSHDMPFVELERDLSIHLTKLADVLHFHSQASVAEVEQAFPIPQDKVRICQHGAYIGAYPDFVSRDAARQALDLADSDEVILFTGQIRPYKGVEALVSAFRKILADRPNAFLIVAGAASFDLLATLKTALTLAEQTRIRLVDRFLEDGELQLFFRAADMAVYPYQKILTSGSMLLALSYGVPVVIPKVGMTAEVLEGQDAGLLYDGDGGDTALEAALRALLARKDVGELAQMGANARKLAERLNWQDFDQLLGASLNREGR